MHNAVIGHDCEIGENTVVLPGAWIGGYVHVGCGGFIGANSVISPRLRLGRNVMLAPGAACLRDAPDDHLVIGNPGRFTVRPTA
jgi:UDP-3-O-[3-hydroxymyristoyl] glucosamine N-acyltransferase